MRERIRHMLLSPQEASLVDAAAIAGGIDSLELMEKAGRGVARIAAQYLGDAAAYQDEVVVICGKGNNAGDGYVAARYLADWGYRVRIMSPYQGRDLSDDASIMASRFEGEVTPVDPLELHAAGMIVDAMVGAGLRGPLSEAIADVIIAANASDAFRLAIDTPSGLDGATASPTGPCFVADATVTFHLRKPAHVMAPGRFLCGGRDQIHVVDIDIPDAAMTAIEPQTMANEASLWSGCYPFFGPTHHKYDRGHALVLGGREPTLGASRLSALAALRVGAGLVTLAAPAETYAVQATAMVDVMVRKFEAPFGFIGMLEDQRIRTVVLGPGAGVGERTAALVEGSLEKGVAVVADADAISSLHDRLERLRPLAHNMILTPHDGEFKRLWPHIQPAGDRLLAARQAAGESGATVVLKGVSTIVATPAGIASINENAPTWLSVGGTGDVLSGIIGGLVAQGMPHFEAASAGVWLQAEAANKLGRGMVASDMLTALPKVLP